MVLSALPLSEFSLAVQGMAGIGLAAVLLEIWDLAPLDLHAGMGLLYSLSAASIARADAGSVHKGGPCQQPHSSAPIPSAAFCALR